MTYPEDVQKALDYAADAGWTRERYQAILALALHHLDKPERPEIHVMWAEEPVPFAVMTYKVVNGERVFTESEGTIPAGQVYFACPVCCHRTTPDFAQSAIETASVDAEYDDELTLYRSSWDGSADGDDSFFICTANGCYAELAVPEWLDFAT